MGNSLRQHDGSSQHQAYYRRASANTAILKHREALRDWKLVVKKAPNDANAKLRMAECDKVVKRDAFLKAIEVEDAPSAAEGLDLEHMAVDPAYDGAKLGDKMTLEFVEDMIERFKNGKKLAKKYVYQIIIAVMDIVKKEPTMVEHDVADGHEITVCGDTHGRLIQGIADIQCTDKARPILRPNGDFPPRGQAFRKARVPIQRRLRRSRFMVHRNRPAAIRLQMAIPQYLLPEPRQPRDRRYEQDVRFRG
jgi:serine/threonine-protein phosphatase 5